MPGIYNALLYLLYPVYRLLTFVNHDFNSFHKARQNLNQKIRRAFMALPEDKKDKPVFWLHGSSAGELDQALALARVIKKRRPCLIAVSVFSKSIRTDSHPEADIFFRLPLDFNSSWTSLLPVLKPVAFITMTWDVWPNLLRKLKKAQIPAFISSAALSEESSHLRWPLRSFYRHCYGLLAGIGAADTRNEAIFRRMAPDVAIKATGDSRYDAILHRLKNAAPKNSRLPTNKKAVILASTYSACDRLVLPAIPHALENDYNVFIFPHHIHPERLKEVEQQLLRFNAEKQILYYSRLKRKPALKQAAIIIVDQLGLLAQAYRLATFCYVGGAFHNRIHNTGEPAACAIPVLSGPRIRASPVAVSLERLGVLFRSATEEEFIVAFRNMCRDPAWCRKLGKRARIFVEKESRASDRFYEAFLKDI